MLTKGDAVDNCINDCVSSFEDDCLDTFVNEGMDIFNDDIEQDPDDITDTLFYNNDVDSENMSEWIDNYCNNLSSSETEELVFSYGIDDAFEHYGVDYGYKCSDIVFGIVHDLMDSSNRAEAISQMKDLVESELSEKIEERKEILEHKKERFESALSSVRNALSEVCDIYETCYGCPFFNKIDGKEHSDCTFERTIEIMKREIKNDGE